MRSYSSPKFSRRTPIFTFLCTALGLSACYSVDPVEEQLLVSEQGVVIPAGQALAHPLRLEAGVVLTGGAWVHDGSEAFESSNFGYRAPETLSEALLLPAGSILIGDTVIPAGVSLEAGSILPGARTLDASGFDSTLDAAAAVVPPNEPLAADVNAVPSASLLTGAPGVLTADLALPAGSVFPNGTKAPDGTIEANDLPNAFPNAELTADAVLPAGTWVPGGVQLPDTVGLTIEGTANAFVGSYRLPEGSVIAAPGIGLPAGTQLDAAVLIPRGAAFLIDSTLPAATELGLGYLEPPLDSPPERRYTGGSTLADEVTLTRGTALLGDVLIPEGVGALSAPLFLPGGTQIARGLTLPQQQRIGMLIPPTAVLSTASFSPANLPAETLLLGYVEPTASALPLPAGSQFMSGYEDSDGSIVQASSIDSATTLPAGSLLLGGVVLPPASTGNYLTFSTDLTLPGGAMIPADGSGNATAQGPEGLTIPVNSWSVSGTSGAAPEDLTFGEELAAPLDMPAGAIYCATAEITEASGFAKITTAQIEYQIEGEAPTQIDVATDFAFTNVVQSFNPTIQTGYVAQEVTGLTPETTYYFRVSLQGCQTTLNVTQGFRTTADPCGGEFELVSVGDVYDGWDGRLGTADESALHVSQMKINPADNRLYIAASKQSDSTANLYRSTQDFFGIEEAGLVVGNQAVRNSTALGFQNFGSDFVYLSFKDNAARGFSTYRWELGAFGADISVASADGVLGGINAADREGFGDATNVWITDSIGARLGQNDVMYLSTRTTGKLYMADSTNGTPGDAEDFTNCAGCGNNGGAGELWSSGTNNVGSLTYVDSGATSGLFIGVGDEGGTAAGISFMPTADVGSTTPTITALTIAGFAGAVVADIAVLNADIVASLRVVGGGQAWRCADYTTNDCSDGANWAKWVDFADGSGLAETDADNGTIRWVRQMPNTGTVFLGTENANGAQIWSGASLGVDLARAPQNACAGLGDASLIAAPTAETVTNAERGVDILYLALHKYNLYDQADAAQNNVYVYRRLEQF